MKICNRCETSKALESFTVKEKLTGKLFNQCRECRSLYSKEHSQRSTFKEVRRLQKVEYWEKNKKELQPKRTAYMNTRRQKTCYKIENSTRAILSSILKGKQKTTSKNFGCDVFSLRAHIENKFKENMSWENYGEWEVDHIIAVSKFDQEKEFDKCWHFSNLQPLWNFENKHKSAS